MLKAKIGPKTTKSHRGKAHVKAPGQPESRTQKKFKGGLAPLGEGVPTPQIFLVLRSRFLLTYAKNREKRHFLTKKNLGGMPPLGEGVPTPQIFLVP